MDEKTGTIKPEQIFEIVIRRRWYLIISFCLAMVVGMLLTAFLPKSYESSTLILIEAQRVPTDLVQSIISIDVGTRINTISEQILSRTNLEKIIKQLNLYTDPGNEKMLMEEKVEAMRKQITVDVTRSGGGRNDMPDSFRISFSGKSPEKVTAVANTLASYFIDENLKVREEQATGTSDFLEGELAVMRQKLEQVEEIMKEYRRGNMGELPEQLESNLRILDRLQEQQIDRQTRLSDAKNRLVILENNLILSGRASSGTDEITNIDQLRDELKNLKNKYTDQHPDIIRLQKKIAGLEKEIEGRKSEGRDEPPAAYSVVDRQKLIEVKAEIETLQNELSDYRDQIIQYKNRVENTPKREQELMSLKRDYQNIQESYSSLLSRKLEAEIARNMERKQKGERFRIIDYARVPEKPASPDMKKLFLLVMAAGLGIGAGIVILLEYNDTSFRRFEEVESYLGLPVITMIPNIVYPSDIRKNQIQKVATVVSLVLSFVLFTGFSAVALIGIDKIQELMK
ncbi:MAG: GNVR domain-containing protein [Desulfobacterales bacterium]